MADQKKFVPFVSPETNMAEFTVRALVIGLVLAVVLGAANAYLGLKAGMTIAATYPAAVIGMALLKLMKGTILEENFVRTVGSIGESIAAGAIFTIPAFYISGLWAQDFSSIPHYLQATAIMLAGGILGIMFVALLRRVMVEDAELPFPESVAASEIHKAGRAGGTGAKYLFMTMGVGALVEILKQFQFFAATWEKFIGFAQNTIYFSRDQKAILADPAKVTHVGAQGGIVLSSPGVSPAFLGVGYIIGPKLASLNFSGGLLAWGFFVPIIMYFLGPQLGIEKMNEGQLIDTAGQIWYYIVRPIAIGGMLTGAGYTLFKMRKSLFTGLSRAVGDVKKAASSDAVTSRTDKDLPFAYILGGIILASIATFFIYLFFSQNVVAALVATVVMIIAGFFFAAVSGYLVGIIGSSNNPISGLTLSTLVIAALLMVSLGMKGDQGVAAVLAVAAVVCVSSAVAGEMLQDLKVGHILGGTPWRMQIGDIIGVAIASAVMFIPLVVLNQGDLSIGGTGFGGKNLSAPQAGLMAMLSQGIVAGRMAWPLIVVGMIMGLGFVLMGVKSPMLVSVGMYLSLETTFAIFIGGMIKGIVERIAEKRKHNGAQKARTENNGVLLASGLIAGEALTGLVFAGIAFATGKKPSELFSFFTNPSFLVSLLVFVVLGYILVSIPLKNAGKPDEPAPPSAVF
jgi:putative OPT family oligopeptide transporter